MDRKNLRGALEYTEKLLSLGEKTIFDVQAASIAAFPEEEFSGREGVTLNPDGGETWIRLKRLRETQAPEFDPVPMEWVEGERSDPDRPPTLKPHRLVKLSVEEISNLCEAGILCMEDVQDPLHPDPEGRKDAILRSEVMPDLQAAWQAYLSGPWARWAEVERPRRRSIALYNKLFQIHQRITSFGDDNPIEIVLGLGLARWQIDAIRVSSPIIEQAVESELEEDGSLVIRPRSLAPAVNLKPFHALGIEASDAVQRETTAMLSRIVETSDLTFSPFEKASYEQILRTCVARLSNSARYHPDNTQEDRCLPPAGEHLIITDTWLLFARQRTEDIRRDDIKRLMGKVAALESDDALPGPARAFVRPPSNRRVHEIGINLENTDFDVPDTPLQRGGHGAIDGSSVSNRAGDSKKPKFLFPLAYNDDQIAIAQALNESESNGVVVQGPPGTGKTHTIANIICHYLAIGKSVLVTAKTAEALTAVQEKLPEGIRSLAISIIHNDREGARQLETAMNLLSNEVKQVDTRQAEQDLIAKQRRIGDINKRLHEIERDLMAIATANLTKVPYRDRSLMPMQLAEEVARVRETHSWFPDSLAPDLDTYPAFTEADVARLREIRTELGTDIAYPTHALPDRSEMPDLAQILSTHEDLKASARIADVINRGEVPLMILKDAADLALARELKSFLDELDQLHEIVSASEWHRVLVEALLRLQDRGEIEMHPVVGLLEEWIGLAERGRVFLSRDVEVGGTHHADQELTEAIENLCMGRSPFGLFSFGKSKVKDKIVSFRIEGRVPDRKKDWAVIRDCRAWHADIDTYLVRWRMLASSSKLPAHAETWTKGARLIAATGERIAYVVRVVGQFPVRKAQTRRLAPYGFEIDRIFHEGETDRLRRALSANISRTGQAEAQAIRARLEALCREPNLQFDAEIRRFAQALGSGEVGSHDLAQAWEDLLVECRRLENLKPKLHELDTLVAKIAASGAPRWAGMLRSVPVDQEPFPLTPATWRETWDWAKADAYVRLISDRERVRLLGEEQARLEAEQKRLFSEIVRLRTFLGLKVKITETVEAALSKFTAAIARLGSGTGKAAPRYRRIIRNSTIEASHAIPCWIMPEWRVSEQLPAELGLFDLVIIDEASQSDVTALPAILRGKKVLVVGDDKQVSPSTVGVEERQIIQLRTTFLNGNPYADQMDPGSSLYDLASIVFPGKAIMLTEHFRCVEPIIRFSSRFYPKALVPLRIPTATERLDPPLIDIFVRDGQRIRDVNEAEAAVVIAEIRGIVEDPAFVNRTIGVISLVGDKQAKLIYDRLLKELGPEAIERHRIMCGNAATFQGQERDIVFLSMVECPQTSRAKTTRVFEQRFNVAMSRARDRVYLVRSVAPEHLSANDLKLRIIEHFQNPMEGTIVRIANDVLEVCESGFEREVGARLIELGYRIRPQVPVGGYRLDFVVEGDGDRRLAIECDGDKYHGPERWAEDLRRQKALERLGWIFWRVWGSHWSSDREGCVSDLINTLNRLGIKPLGAAPVAYRWTEHRLVVSSADGTNADDLNASQQAQSDVFQVAAPAIDSTAPIAGVEAAPFSERDARSVKAQPAVRDDHRAQIGDSLVIRYTDTNKVMRVHMSDRENRPNEGIINVGQPLGRALLGASVDDEVEFSVAGKTRAVIIERIEREALAAAE